MTEPETLDELRAYLQAHFLDCSSWDFDGEDPVGGFRFSCACGEASGFFPEYAHGVAVLDAHLDARDAERRKYVKSWAKRHRPSAGEIEGEGWSVHVMEPGEADPETGRRRVRFIQTSGSTRGPEELPAPIADDLDEGWEGMELPVLDFPVYGCGDAWTGPRWLDFIQNRSGQGGEGADEVWLGHSETRSPVLARPSIRVATLPWERFIRLMGHHGEDELHTVAFQTAFSLIDITAPDLPATRRQRLHRGIVHEMDTRADGYAAWPTATWYVDGRPVTARILHWAGAWAGFAVEVPEVALIVVANAIAPDSLRLVNVTDDPRYHVDFRQPLNFPRSLMESAAAALGSRAEAEGERWPLHEDHERLLREAP